MAGGGDRRPAGSTGDLRAGGDVRRRGGAGGENHSWALETYNISGKAAPDPSSFKSYDADVTRCTAANGIGFNSTPTISALVSDGLSGVRAGRSRFAASATRRSSR
jgi:hypothetical protein